VVRPLSGCSTHLFVYARSGLFVPAASLEACLNTFNEIRTREGGKRENKKREKRRRERGTRARARVWGRHWPR